MQQSTKFPPGFRHLNSLAKLMDSQFRVPGTNVRFGVDALIGLVPGVGDLISFLISSYMISSAKKNGASEYVVARMMTNVVIDALVGAIPLIGDLFDVAFKANQKNMKLLQQHFNEGRHGGSAKRVMIPIMIVAILILAALIYGIYRLFVWIF